MTNHKTVQKYAEFTMQAISTAKDNNITMAELNVLQALVNHHGNFKKAASEINISENTIHTHTRRIRIKLKADNITDLLFKAIKLGMIVFQCQLS